MEAEDISRRKYGTLLEVRLLVDRIAYRTQRRSRGLQTSSLFFIELDCPEKAFEINFEIETSGVACRLLPRTSLIVPYEGLPFTRLPYLTSDNHLNVSRSM